MNVVVSVRETLQTEMSQIAYTCVLSDGSVVVCGKVNGDRWSIVRYTRVRETNPAPGTSQTETESRPSPNPKRQESGTRPSADEPKQLAEVSVQEEATEAATGDSGSAKSDGVSEQSTVTVPNEEQQDISNSSSKEPESHSTGSDTPNEPRSEGPVPTANVEEIDPEVGTRTEDSAKNTAVVTEAANPMECEVETSCYLRHRPDGMAGVTLRGQLCVVVSYT